MKLEVRCVNGGGFSGLFKIMLCLLVVFKQYIEECFLVSSMESCFVIYLSFLIITAQMQAYVCCSEKCHTIAGKEQQERVLLNKSIQY
jgi:hypothetical protein